MDDPTDKVMKDQIQIKNLLLRTIIGINEEERRNRQDVLINVTLFADTRPAGKSDEIADAKPSANAGSNVESETATSISGFTFLKALRG